MNFISYVIIALGVAALWHAIYEAILLPSIRLDSRYKLFALRDRLRSIKIAHPQQCNNDAFRMLDDSLSWQMNNLSKLTFSLLHEITDRLKKDTEFVEEIKRRIKILDSCQLPEYAQIRKEQGTVVSHVFALNGGGWAIYLIPFAIAFAAWKKAMQNIKIVNSVRSSELDHMSPCAA